jgi:hypothetical protein
MNSSSRLRSRIGRCAGACSLAMMIGVTAILLLPARADAETRAADAPAPRDEAGFVTTHTYLAAAAGRRAALARFIVANWFAMDARAVEQGLFRSFRLLENPATGEDWDLIVEVVYNDACGYACVAAPFETIRRAHQTVAIEGETMPALGRVVRSVSFQEATPGQVVE